MKEIVVRVITESSGGFSAESSKLEDLIGAISNLNNNLHKLSTDTEQVVAKTIETTKRTETSNKQSIANISSAIASAIPMSLASNAAKNLGNVFGQQANAINTGALGSTGFAISINQQYTQQLKSLQNDSVEAIATGVLAGVGSILSPLGTLIGAAAGHAIGGTFGYFNNKNTATSLAAVNLGMISDQSAIQAKSMLGASYGGVLHTNIMGHEYPTKLSQLRNEMLSSPYGAYADQYQLSMPRDMYRRYGATSNQVETLTKQAMGMGLSEQQLSQYYGTVGTFGRFTNKNMESSSNSLYKNAAWYGGDTMGIANNAMNLMTTTGFGSNALDLAARYQNNPAALQNITAWNTSSPVNKWLTQQFLKIAGESDKDIAKGSLSSKSLNAYRRAQNPKGGIINDQDLIQSMLTDQAYTSVGKNINVRDVGILPKIPKSFTPDQPDTPQSVNAQHDFIQDALQGIKVDTQYVYASQVVIQNTGNFSDAMISNSNIAGAITNTNQKR